MPPSVAATPRPTGSGRPGARRPGVLGAGARGPGVLGLGVLGLGALVAAAVGLVVTGAAAATLVDDAGTLTRWGLPLVRAVSDVASALTVGLLVLAATALPAGKRGVLDGAAERAARLAAAAGGVWVLTGAVVIVLTYARLAALPPSAPGFATQLAHFVTELDLLKALLVSVLLAAVVATGAALATRHTTVGWMAVLALAALLPIALTGHAAGSASHELAVDSLAGHLLGVSVWVGGLAALVLLRPRLGRTLPAVAGRYSTLALWAFVAVAGSGVLNAAIRLGHWGALATPYGALVLGKVTAVLLLGLAGWTHRRSLLARLGTGAAGPFWRLVAGELAVMGVAIGLGVALANSSPPVADGAVTATSRAFVITGYPMPSAPTVWTWVTAWRVDLLWTTAAVLMAVGYLVGVRRLGARGDRWPVGRTICWLLGCAVVVWATSGAPGIYGRVLFSSHMLGHMTMSMVAPPLLVLGAPVTLALRSLTRRRDGSRGPREWLLTVVHSRLLRLLGHPLVAAGLFAVSLIVFYYSPLFELSLRTHTGHVLMHLHFLLVGYLFASVLIGVDPGPARPPYPLRLLLLFATMAFHAFFGVALLQGTVLLGGGLLAEMGRTWGRSPLLDQQFGGAVAWGVGELPTLLLGMGVAIAWVRSDDRDSRRSDRQADRDGDAELAAYNARLAALAEQSARAERRP